LNNIIIGAKEPKEYIYLIWKFLQYNDLIKIRYLDKYKDKAEAIIKGFEKFGMLQAEITKIKDSNKRCEHNNNGLCKNKKSTFEKCHFNQISSCKFYEQADTSEFVINEVTLEKIGAIQGL